MDMDGLRTFIAVAETRSFTRAAKQQYCTQAAVSMRIKKLEEKLECSLFRRMAKCAELTREGEILLPFVREIVNIWGSAQDALFQSKLLEQSEVSITSSSTPGTYIIPDCMYRFRQRHPCVTVLNHVQYTKGVIADILAKRYPLGIVSQPILNNTDVLTVTPVTEDPLALIINPKHPWAGRAGVWLKELNGETLLISNPHTSLIKYIEQIGRFTLDPQQLYVVGNIEVIKRSVISNLGVALISRYAIMQELQLNLLTEVAVLDDYALSRTIYSVHRKDTPLSVSAVLFLKFILDGTATAQE
jgi:DNA-binding transcriptional LysR family regulator